MATKVVPTQKRRGRTPRSGPTRGTPHTPKGTPFTWVDHRRTVLTNEERCTLLGLVNKLTFTNMDTISARLVEGMKDPYLLGEAVELIFHQGLNPAFMVLFSHLCSRLTRDSPFFGSHGEINFKTVLLNKYRVELERAVFVQVPSLVELCAKRVAASSSGHADRDDGDHNADGALLPQELVSYLRERPWAVTPKILHERWRRMNDLIVLLGEFYNVGLVGEDQVRRMLEQLSESIEHGVRRNVEPLCRLLATVGPALDGRRGRRRAGSADDEAQDDLDDLECNDGFVLPPGSDKTPTAQEDEKDEEKHRGLAEYMVKIEGYLGRVREWQLGERIRFMIQDVLELKARNWQSHRAS